MVRKSTYPKSKYSIGTRVYVTKLPRSPMPRDLLDDVAPVLKPPPGSGLQLQSSFDGGGGQTHFKGGGAKKKGKKAAKKTAKKKAKKGSGSLAQFGVMPKGQATLEEIIEGLKI